MRYWITAQHIVTATQNKTPFLIVAVNLSTANHLWQFFAHKH